MKSKITELKSIKEFVEKILIHYPDTKDSDDKLLANLWYRYLGADAINGMTALDLLKLLSKGELPSYENASRVRRKLQEEKVELRGTKYKERHKLEAEVRQGIKNV